MRNESERILCNLYGFKMSWCCSLIPSLNRVTFILENSPKNEIKALIISIILEWVPFFFVLSLFPSLHLSLFILTIVLSNRRCVPVRSHDSCATRLRVLTLLNGERQWGCTTECYDWLRTRSSLEQLHSALRHTKDFLSTYWSSATAYHHRIDQLRAPLNSDFLSPQYRSFVAPLKITSGSLHLREWLLVLSRSDGGIHW